MILPHILLVFPLITLDYRIIGGGGGGLEISPKTNNREGGKKCTRLFKNFFHQKKYTHAER